MSWLREKMLNGKNIKGLSPSELKGTSLKGTVPKDANEGDTISFGLMGVPALAQWVSLKEVGA